MASGCRFRRVPVPRAAARSVAPFARPTEAAMFRAHAFARAAHALRAEGFVPDIVLAHAGPGAGTLCPAVWPQARFVAYAEWFYRFPHVDADPTVPSEPPESGRARALARNMPILADLAQADLVTCPTRFQADQFPAHIAPRVEIWADGVDAVALAPPTGARPLPPGVVLPKAAEVVTYATRGMEPHRGFPDFMRALAVLQRDRPALHAIIAGQDSVAYGSPLPDGETWKIRMLRDLDLDISRIHFVGTLPAAAYRALLHASHVHVYLTVPFVLSWSLRDAMAAACAIVASDCAPVREVLRDGVSARLVDHRDAAGLARAVATLLDAPDTARAMGAAARQTILATQDRRLVWPRRAARLQALMQS